MLQRAAILLSGLAMMAVATPAAAQWQSDDWGAPTSRARQPGSPLLAARIAALGSNFGGKVGISVRDVATGWSTGYGETRLCPQQSVSKFWVAITVMDAIDHGTLTLNDPVLITRNDLTLFHQPIRALVGDSGYRATVGELLDRAITESDNTANDSLLRTVGGPAAVRATLARLGINSVRFGPGERLLQSRIAGMSWDQSMSQGNGFEVARARLSPDTRRRALLDYIADPMDGAAPAAITSVLAQLDRGTLLSPASSRYLLGVMGRTKTGARRMKAALAPGWELAHKTGTGQQYGSTVAGFNDVGLLTAPDGHTYAIAVMIAQSERPIAQRQQLIADVARVVMDSWNGTHIAGTVDAVY